MKTFFKTILKFLLVPIIIVILVIVGYFIFDPFRIIYSYDSYSHTHSDRDYYSIEMLKKNYPKEHYDSFIFGSSRTLAFRPSSWIKYLDDGANPFMLDGYGDNIYGIYHKIKYLDSLDIEIKNALVILDVDDTFSGDYPLDEFFFYLKHPDIDGSSWSQFKEKHFLAYLNSNVIVSFYLNKFFGIENKFIYNYIGNIRASVDSISNELRREDLENRIQTDPYYYDNQIFYERGDTLIFKKPQISNKQYKMLTEVHRIFEKDSTNYKIIVGPMYSQSRFAESDMEIFNQIFGKNNVYDFSGVNEFSKSKYNYYETSHYRPLVGDSIMKYIYKEK